ncbi:PREDICTED: uncharacterized protein LOC109226028 [Nicotiana attenuata]|uniref:uncharacterized protein LOC109226028 n=1 Tax=Nicotiana attenuata TaxID=49451 RepID=UPI0009057355|nr:PREDICTED: uncharacterized protein LOC109226028 [Nicotiana attenuata]
MLTTEYELFRMKDDKSIQDMHTRFTSIINELHSLGEIIPRNKLVRKILSVLPGSWESKVNAITEAKDLQKLTINEHIGNLKTYEMNKKKDNKRRDPKREKNLVLKTDNYDSGGEDGDMAYLTKRFQKMVRRNRGKWNKVPDKNFKRKDAADNIVKQALAAWGGSSSESGDDDDQGDSSMMAVESEAAEYDSIFALMAKLDEDEEVDDEDEVNFLDVQRNLKSYSHKKLTSLANVLIDAYHSLINDKNALTTELGEIEHERDDLVVVAVDLRETIESLKREKDILSERIANIEHERDVLLVVVVDLKELIEELRRESRLVNTQKGKEVASEEDLGEVKSDLEKSLKMTWSSNAITATHTNNGGGRGEQETCKARFESQQKNKVFAEKGAVKGSSQRWYMDSGCSKHKTGSTDDFLSLKALQGGSVSFENGKKGYILGVGRIGKSLTHSIENVYYVNGLKYGLLSVSQICDKGNKVEFVSKICTVTNLVTGDVILMAKRFKNIYVADFESLHNRDLTCLSAMDDDAELWHRRLGHASFTLLNKLVRKDLVRGLPKSSFNDHKVYDACAKGKQIRSSFKPKKEVSTSRPLDLLHMDLCGPMRVPSRGGKK